MMVNGNLVCPGDTPTPMMTPTATNTSTPTSVPTKTPTETPTVTATTSPTPTNTATPLAITPASVTYLPALTNYIPPTLTPTVTPFPTATPLPTPISQPIMVGSSITCHQMQMVAVHSEITPQLGGYVAPQGGQFVLVTADVTNLGYRADDWGRYDSAIQDSYGRQFSMADLDYQRAAWDKYGLKGIYTDILPSFSQRMIFVWISAVDSTGLFFVPDTLC